MASLQGHFRGTSSPNTAGLRLPCLQRGVPSLLRSVWNYKQVLQVSTLNTHQKGAFPYSTKWGRQVGNFSLTPVDPTCQNGVNDGVGSSICITW